MTPLSIFQIRNLCKNNEVISKAYKAFREKHPFEKVFDMWEQAHFQIAIDEAVIIYAENYTIKSFVFEERL